jgi:transcriptional regulator with GAF, ATPase, and Fis domain
MSDMQANSTELLEKKLREFRALAEMNKEIHSTMNIHQLLKILVEKAVVGVNFERCLIYLLEENYLRCVAWIDRIKKEKASIIKKRVGFHMEENAAEVLAVKTGKPLYIENPHQDHRVSAKLLRVSETKEYCIAPLIGRNKVLGVLTGDKPYCKEPILPSDIQTLMLFAGHISLAIENSLLYEEKERFNKVLEKRVQERTSELAEANQELSTKMTELSTLYKMSRLLNQSLHQNAVLDQIVTSVGELGYDACSVRITENDHFRVVVKCGLDEDYDAFADVPVTDSPYSDLLETTNAFAVSDLSGTPVPEPFREYCRLRSIRGCIVMPLVTKGNMIGQIRIYSQIPSILKDTQKDFFSAFGQQAAAALENAMMFEKILEEKNKIENLSQRIEQENIYLKERIKTDFVIGKSSKMKELMDLVHKVAPTSTTVILYGETGTGKELIANAIHEISPRKDCPLIKVNCAAIPEELIESELFGHEKGAFTGAHEKHIGMFELANGGTIFLDEIGDLAMKTQTKLLRVLQEQEIQRIGSKAPIRVDVRVIAATNKDLRKNIEERTFRPDLFYRLNVFPITLPPLRERKEDIEELINVFLSKYASLRHLKMTLSQEAMAILLTYSWPGNVRELKNILERLVIISRDNVITKKDLPKELWQEFNSERPIRPLRTSIREFKREQVFHALSEARGKKSTAAEMLGLPRSNFSRLLKSLDLP